MKSTKYVKKCTDLECTDFDRVRTRLSDDQTLRMLHVAMGLVTEAGEVMDMLKKHIWYGRELDLTNFVEELGDSNFYIGIGIDVLCCKARPVTFEDIWDINMNKLDGTRFKNGKFSEDDANNRDLDAEREVLEGPCGKQ